VKRRTVARLIAILLLGYGVAFVIVSGETSDMARYRTLSRDALLDDLASNKNGDFDNDFFVGLLIVGGISLLADGIAFIVMLVMNRISPLPQPQATPTE
jgi:hypothetical protein